MRELEKNSPVPVRKEMSITEYSKLVDTNANLVDKIKERQEIIKKMQNNEESLIKIMKQYEDYKLRIDKTVEYIKHRKETCERQEDVIGMNILISIEEILKGSDK